MALVQCFIELLGSLFNKICRGDEELAEMFGRLPDCVVIDILSRLPIDSLVRFRRDCRDLRALISSQYFTTLHLSRARPMLLLHDCYDPTKHKKRLYVLSENVDKKELILRELYLQPELKINKHLGLGERSPSPIYSCQGVLLFANKYYWPRTTYYVLNPITQEEVIVQHTHHPGRLCAFYFCRGFKLFYAQVRRSWCQYLVYIFKTQTWRKVRSSCTFNFLPYRGSPAIVNGALHWIVYTYLKKDLPNCANGIMVFRMDKEELSAMPHPGRVCKAKQVHETMRLLVKENCLSFCHLLVSELAVYIWILEDYEMWAWNKRYKVNICNTRFFPLGLPYGGVPRNVYWWIKFFYIQDGELVFYYMDSVFSYNLDHKTVKGFKLPQMLFALGTYIKSLVAIA